MFVWPSENRRSGASRHEKKNDEEEEHERQEKPKGHWTPPFPPSPRGAKYITVTQDINPSGVDF